MLRSATIDDHVEEWTRPVSQRSNVADTGPDANDAWHATPDELAERSTVGKCIEKLKTKLGERRCNKVGDIGRQLYLSWWSDAQLPVSAAILIRIDQGRMNHETQ